jgi:ATP-dependent Clp protease ATP-binding subunit ClpA
VSPLIRASFREARQRRTTWVGFEHLLAALANDPDQSKARSALRACGLDELSIAVQVPQVEEYGLAMPPLEEHQGPKPNPYWYRLIGRAEGFAHAANSEQVLSEHVLLALLWERDHQPTLLTQLLGQAGRTPLDLQTALAHLGVPVPRGRPPVEK